MNNLIQKWIIYHPRTQSFVTRSPFNYTQSPDLATIYHNYSDAIMACNNHYDKEFDGGHHPVELRFHFNPKTLNQVKQGVV
jgi:hypothetical protein